MMGLVILFFGFIAFVRDDMDDDDDEKPALNSSGIEVGYFVVRILCLLMVIISLMRAKYLHDRMKQFVKDADQVQTTQDVPDEETGAELINDEWIELQDIEPLTTTPTEGVGSATDTIETPTHSLTRVKTSDE